MILPVLVAQPSFQNRRGSIEPIKPMFTPASFQGYFFLLSQKELIRYLISLKDLPNVSTQSDMQTLVFSSNL